MPNVELADCVDRIDRLLAKIETLPDPVVRGDVQEIVQCLLDYHGAAVARMLSLMQSSGESPNGVNRLADDELVSSLLLLHGLHPADLEDRVLGALESVRPFLQSHGGNVELVHVADAVVRLRLQGNCHGCPSSAATLKSRIEQAIYESAPDVASIVVVDEEPQVTMPSGFVELEKLTIGSLDHTP